MNTGPITGVNFYPRRSPHRGVSSVAKATINTKSGLISISRAAVQMLKVVPPLNCLLGTDNQGRIIIKECEIGTPGCYPWQKSNQILCREFIKYLMSSHLLELGTDSYKDEGKSLYYNIFRDKKSKFLVICSNRKFSSKE